jgi:hypothetical protein
MQCSLQQLRYMQKRPCRASETIPTKLEENMKQSKQTASVENLRAEARELSKKLEAINAEIRRLEMGKRRHELEKNVGKYFVEAVTDTCKRFFYVIGVDKEGERNTVLSIVIGSGGWFQFEKMDTPIQVNSLRQITRREFVDKLRKIKPFFEQAEYANENS